MDNTSIKSVFITEHAFKLYQSKKITIQEALMLSIITSLDNEKGCFATNKYFADNLPIEVDRVKEIIKALVKKGYVKSRMTNNNTRRVLNVVNLEEKESAQHDPSTEEVKAETQKQEPNKVVKIGDKKPNTYKPNDKVKKFNDIPSHNWDFDKIGQMEDLRLAYRLGNISEEEYHDKIALLM